MLTHVSIPNMFSRGQILLSQIILFPGESQKIATGRRESLRSHVQQSNFTPAPN
jgi:hypothetical protein